MVRLLRSSLIRRIFILGALSFAPVFSHAMSSGNATSMLTGYSKDQLINCFTSYSNGSNVTAWPKIAKAHSDNLMKSFDELHVGWWARRSLPGVNGPISKLKKATDYLFNYCLSVGNHNSMMFQPALVALSLAIAKGESREMLMQEAEFLLAIQAKCESEVEKHLGSEVDTDAWRTYLINRDYVDGFVSHLRAIIGQGGFDKNPSGDKISFSGCKKFGYANQVEKRKAVVTKSIVGGLSIAAIGAALIGGILLFKKFSDSGFGLKKLFGGLGGAGRSTQNLIKKADRKIFGDGPEDENAMANKVDRGVDALVGNSENPGILPQAKTVVDILAGDGDENPGFVQNLNDVIFEGEQANEEKGTEAVAPLADQVVEVVSNTNAALAKTVGTDESPGLVVKLDNAIFKGKPGNEEEDIEPVAPLADTIVSLASKLDETVAKVNTLVGLATVALGGEAEQSELFVDDDAGDEESVNSSRSSGNGSDLSQRRKNVIIKKLKKTNDQISQLKEKYLEIQNASPEKPAVPFWFIAKKEFSRKK